MKGRDEMSATAQSISITKILILLALAFTLGFLLAYWLVRPQPPPPDTEPKAQRPPGQQGGTILDATDLAEAV
jgi:hypothetical protein